MKTIKLKNSTVVRIISVFSLLFMLYSQCNNTSFKVRSTEDFCKNWKFHLGDINNARESGFDDSDWRMLNLPHDWSIEGEFSDKHPATPGGGALPGGIGWYRKAFAIPETDTNKAVFVDFDGVYMNSEVWINSHYLGKRPNGYISFRYELTPYLKYGNEKNIIAVKVDNSNQPNSRWYSGSGIYRNVWLVLTEKVFVDHWGTFVTTPEVSEQSAKVSVTTNVLNDSQQDQLVKLKTIIYDANGKKIAALTTQNVVSKKSVSEVTQNLVVKNPTLWSVENPYLYKAVSQVECNGKVCDDCETIFGIRYFSFDPERGFFLNGKQIKILGVCNHHDLGCLGAAINTRALERQLEILKEMGCNGIRTSHNPPAPELLDLCDKMGFIVMDEAFDMWKKKKTEYDYHLYWNDWYKHDLEDVVLRDRNHPSVFIWSIGNEVIEQWDHSDSSGSVITRKLTAIIKELDPTRPITAACNDVRMSNPVIKSGVLDLIGYNYNQGIFKNFKEDYPDQKFIATETTSSLATRGNYDMPSDSVRRWPSRWDIPLTTGNADYTCSAYDNCSAPWGSTHEETWKIIKKYDFISGMYIWTGFDYLGEPTPYGWPSRSSYFGVIDLAGFPKDAYYFYQSEWTDKPVLHVFPHWNWNEGDTVDIWAYTNYNEVELFLNDESLGAKQKTEDDLHLAWKVSYTPGTIKAVAKNENNEILTQKIQTAGAAAAIQLYADRTNINADGRDLSFITVKVVDQNGTMVPHADNLINFEIQGEGVIAGVDNGCQTSHEPFKANYRKAFNGMCLVIIHSKEKAGKIILKATSDGLEESAIIISIKKPV